MAEYETLITPAELQLFLSQEERFHDAANRLIGEYRRTWLDALGLPHWKPRNTPYDERTVGVEALVVDDQTYPYEGLTLDDIGPAFISYSGMESQTYGKYKRHTYTLPTSHLFEDWRPGLQEAIQQALAAQNATKTQILNELTQDIDHFLS